MSPTCRCSARYLLMGVVCVCVFGVTCVALLTGHDGLIVTTAIGSLAAIGGYAYGSRR